MPCVYITYLVDELAALAGDNSAGAEGTEGRVGRGFCIICGRVRTAVRCWRQRTWSRTAVAVLVLQRSQLMYNTSNKSCMYHATALSHKGLSAVVSFEFSNVDAADAMPILIAYYTTDFLVSTFTVIFLTSSKIQYPSFEHL